MGYSMGLPIEEFRSMEKILDGICRTVMPPAIAVYDAVQITDDIIGGVPGIWCRTKGSTEAPATILYLHGGGYIGTSPIMYSAFAASLVKTTGYDLFIADYRMAPEFPFPAGVFDAADTYRGLLDRGVDADRIIVAGDSGGGGLATSLISLLHERAIPAPAALALFSPEVDLALDQPSVLINAPHDILPWSVPVTPYLQGVAPNDARVSATYSDPDPDWFPPTFVCWGADEMFRDGIRAFVERLEKSGVRVVAMEEFGMFHVFPILMPWAESSKRVFAALHELSAQHVEP